jgi:radical SAM superfamily enzyme YgiQ (UPF0313 family)
MRPDRVILVNSGNRIYEGATPLGLMTVATILQRQHGLQTRIVDLPVEESERLESQIGSFWDEMEFGPVLFVGFSTLCNTLPRSLSLARSLKSKAPHLPIILGGPEASARAQDLVDTYPFIDAIAVGEVESTMGDLVTALRTGVPRSQPGMIFQDDWRVASTAPDTDASVAPLVDLDAAEPIDYATYPQSSFSQSIPIEVGRGCPFNCSFCSTNGFFSRRFRLKSPERIISEVAALVRDRHVGHFDFIHDMFTTNRKLVVKVCQGLIQSRLGVTWGCSARTDRVDEELLTQMMRAGCTDIYFGLETGSPRIQKLIRKNLNLDDAMAKLRLASNLGIRVTTSLIIGFPQEQESDLADTLDLALRLRQWRPRLGSVQVHLLAPLAGTDLTTAHFGELRYDGHIAGATSVNYLTEWEEREIRKQPTLFSSFYYCPNTAIARATYKWLHWAMTETGDPRNAIFSDRDRASGATLLNWAKLMGSFPVLGVHARPTSARCAQQFAAPAASLQ